MTTSVTRHQAPADGRNRREGAAQAASSRGARRRAARRQQLAAWLFITPVAIYLVLFYAYPLYRNLDLSFRDYTLRSFISGSADFVGLANYRDVLTDPAFGTALWNTVVFTGVSLLFQYAIGLALAVFFFRRFPLATTLRALFLVPWLLPLLVSASVWAWMLNSDSGVVNWFLESIGLNPIYWLTSPDCSTSAPSKRR
ncbi:carbohydrate ABC transporter permease [Demequina lutea]|uniref:Multiple sugar transport system permease protein n=1 Tax=Demequina lutea TaxID=431489 RepID=A0A7Y9ZC06_9MICO|nr:sugar ABC transporter permease [Demequina lutea]NYI41808.1 multiple sugar transport system permease protein [Demequina lutea]